MPWTKSKRLILNLMLALVASIACSLITATAQAQSMTDIVTVTVGGIYDGPSGAGFRNDGLKYGSITPGVTSNGYTYIAVADNGAFSRKGVGIPPSSWIHISGLASNPGQSWLTSVTALGVTTTGAKATSYTYSGGIASWLWTGTSWGMSSGTAQVSITHLAPPIGYLDLKYVIVGVDYAPPGSKSTVSYGNNTIRGTGATDTHSYKTDVSLTNTGDIGANLFGIAAGGVTGTFDLDYQQVSSNSSSVTVTNTTALTDVIPGPSSSAVGVDHDYDVIWVWLNPEAAEYVGNNTVSFAGYGYNAEDDHAGVEVVPIQVAQLKNPSLMSAGLKARLARTWDGSGVGGLTTSDYSAILTADPFATNSSYNPGTDPNHRFQAATDQTIPYVPPAPGGLPVTVTGNFTTQTATSTSQSATNQYTVGFSITFSSSADWVAEFSEKLTISASYTITDMWSSSLNSTVGKTAAYSITGPQVSDNYTGPVSFQVYRDNVYGSFMFYPL